MFSSNRTIGFPDCDFAGVIFFPKVFELAHSVFEEFMHVSGYYKEYFINRKIVYPIIHADVSFLNPIKIGDSIIIMLSLKSIRTSSFEVEYEFSSSNSELKAIVTTVHCAVDSVHENKTEICDQLREILEKLK